MRTPYPLAFPLASLVSAPGRWLRATALAVLAAALPLGAHAQLGYSPTTAQVVAGTYTDLGTTGTAITVANTDDDNSAAQPIGFSFQFEGQTFTQFVLSTNGFLKLGGSAPSTTTLYYTDPQAYTGTSAFNSTDPADVNLIAAFGCDLTTSPTATAEFRRVTTGAAPNRVCTVQWKDMSDYGSTTFPNQYDDVNFQIKLYETSNRIELVYGSFTSSANTAGFRGAEAGLRGTGTADYLTVTKGSTAVWTAATFQAANYVGTNNRLNFRAGVTPVAGTTYRFDPVFATDAAVAEIYSLGKLPIPQGVPHVVSAAISNTGSNARTNLVVTLTVSGVTTFTNTRTIASLAAGATTTVTFNAYTPTTSGTNTLTVTIPSDDNATNNSRTWTQIVNTTTFRYADAGAPTDAIGFNTGEGTLLVKHTTAQASTVVNTKIWLDAGSGASAGAVAGQTVYAVVLGATGTILSQTAPYVVQAADLGAYKTFTFTTPVAVPAGDFYVGLAQTNPNAVAYFPVAAQDETPVRAGAYFAGTLAGGALPTDFTTIPLNARLLIEATLSAPNACATPLNFALGTITATSAALSYGAVTGAIGYTLIYGPTGFDPTTGGTSVNVTGTSPTLSGLTALTGYDVYVRTRCSSTSVSNLAGPLSFTTSCAGPAITLPYVENFDSSLGATLPCGWSQINADGDTSNWRLSSLAPSSPTRSLTLRWTEPGITQDDWVITPGVTLTAGQSVDLTFKYRAGGATFPNNLEVKVGRAATVVGLTTQIFNSQGYTGTNYRLGGGTFTATTAGTYFFGFHAYSDPDEETTWIDDVRIAPAGAADAAVVAIYSLGKLPIPQGAPHVVTAAITNNSVATITNLPVTLTVSGVTTFTNTKTIASLAVGATAVVTFNAYSPTTTGTNTLTVTVPADGDATNNSRTWTQLVTTTAFRYADDGPLAQGVGYSTGEGTILVKHTTAQATSVVNTKVWLTNGTGTSTAGNIVGQTVYAVVLDASGAILSQTPALVVQAADVDAYHTFTFAAPVAVPVGDFYVGLAQTNPNAISYFPVGSQNEAPIRTGAYFSGTLAGGAIPTDFATIPLDLRPMIEVTLVSPCLTPTIATTAPTAVCAGGSVLLTASGVTGGAYQFLLNGQPVSGATGTTYSATQAGTYTVAATAGACSTTSTTSVTVTINGVPAIPGFTPASRCGPGPVTLTVFGAPTGGSYAWYTTATGGTPLSGATGATYTTPSLSATTTYYVTALSSAGCESSPRAAVTATISTPPAPTLAAGSATTFCDGGSVLLTAANGGAGATYQFLLNGQPISGATGTTYTASQSGQYAVTATANTCPGTSPALTVTVNPTPTAPSASDASRCGPGTVTLSAFGAPTGGRYVWYTQATGGTPIAGANGASYTTPSLSATTTYYVATANAANCESPRVAATATVNAQPAPTLTPNGPTTFCDGGAVTLTAAGGGTGASYQFLLNGQPITGATGTSYFATQTGQYSVLATTPTCSGTSPALSVTATPPPSAAFAYATSTFCLSGANPVPTITGATGGTFSSTAGLSLNATTGVVNLGASTAGTYVVTYALTQPCAASATQTVTVTSAPSAAFTLPVTGPVCAGSTGSVTPALSTGASAGTFTATPAGLSLDPVTGVVDVALSAAGTYTVTNTIAASGSCAASSATATLTLAPGATASLTPGGATTFCQGDSVILTGAGNGTYQYLLNGQPIVGATSGPLTVRQAGTYSLVVVNTAGCSATSTGVVVTVNAVPSAAFAYGASAYCLGGTNPAPTIAGAAGGTFSSPSLNLSLDPATGTVNLSASAPGTYTVTYAVAGPCPASMTYTLTLTAPATAGFSYASGAPLCSGQISSVRPTLGTGATAGAFSSTPAGLTLDPTTGEVTVNTSAAGVYTVTNLVAGGAGCANATATATLTIAASPNATLTASGPLTICAGDSVLLTATGGGTYQFVSFNVPIPGATGSTYYATQSGVYSVIVTNAAGCSSSPSDIGVTVNPVPSAAFTYTANAFCLDGTMLAPVISGAQGGVFSVTSTGLIISGAGVINLGTSAPGTYTITYSVVNPGGSCSASSSQTLTLTATALAGFSYPIDLCAGASGGPVTPSLLPGATAGTFSATPAGLVLNSATGVVDASASTPGIYTVTNTVAGTGSCGSATATATLELLAPPAAPTIAAQPQASGIVILTASAPNAASYQWYLNGTLIPGAVGATLAVTTALQSGTYTAVANSGAGCASSSSAGQAVTVTGTAAALPTQLVQLAPNPTEGRAALLLTQPLTAAAPLLIFDATGRQVLETTVPAGATRHELDLTALPVGVYAVRLLTPEGTVTRRLVRQ